MLHSRGAFGAERSALGACARRRPARKWVERKAFRSRVGYGKRGNMGGIGKKRKNVRLKIGLVSLPSPVKNSLSSPICRPWFQCDKSTLSGHPPPGHMDKPWISLQGHGWKALFLLSDAVDLWPWLQPPKLCSLLFSC